MQSNIRVVLVSPLYGGNVGSVCRAMANMGVSDLVVVNPSPDLDLVEAHAMACHARPLLEGRRTVSSLEEAVGDCIAVVGTTARKGLYRQHARTAREWAPEIAKISDQGRVALVFGREDKGLLNDEIALCTHLVQIPTDAEYTSLNLAQAALVLCYELFLAQGVYHPVREKSDPAPVRLRERMFALWRRHLLDIGFMEEQKADHMMAGFRRVLDRGAFTTDDVKIMLGVAQQGSWAALHPKVKDAAPVPDAASAAGELTIIRRLTASLASRPDVLVGPGDDCAVVAMNDAQDLLLKSDPLICGRHFLPSADMRLVGRKALARVLSDLASCGAEPRWALVNVVYAPDTTLAQLEEIYSGLEELARRHGVAIVGGDTARADTLALHVFACGTVPHSAARLRSAARPGDLVGVTGPLGGSIEGHHLTFEPRIAEGRALRPVVNAMTDISDGLSTELWHIAEASRVALEIDPAAVPLNPGCTVANAFGDGEDYELVFTVPAERAAEVAVPHTIIGRVTAAHPAGTVALVSGESLPRTGFEHR